jgi:hypothetical protein
MNSARHGKNTSATDFGAMAEVTHVSSQGIWLLVGDREFFLTYARFPWFQEARIREIHQVTLLHGTHLYWPSLDVDLELESLEHPENYPLVAGSVRLVADAEDLNPGSPKP